MIDMLILLAAAIVLLGLYVVIAMSYNRHNVKHCEQTAKARGWSYTFRGDKKIWEEWCKVSQWVGSNPGAQGADFVTGQLGGTPFVAFNDLIYVWYRGQRTFAGAGLMVAIQLETQLPNKKYGGENLPITQHLLENTLPSWQHQDNSEVSLYLYNGMLWMPFRGQLPKQLIRMRKNFDTTLDMIQQRVQQLKEISTVLET